MAHSVLPDAAAEVDVQAGAVVSKVVHPDPDLNVTLFGFDAGEGLTEHQASRAASVQVLAGRMRFTADDEEIEAAAGCWIHMSPRTPHSLVAVEPAVMLLTLLPAERRLPDEPDRHAPAGPSVRP
jgi:quercetin dioxygenase-like cupin family protein